ncbi:hypothetical protein B0J14DRAFT_492783 [Halenospora varia]|nr:hypothetical protein B0J14DRAFT_492783 [Halenospora varia]
MHFKHFVAARVIAPVFALVQLHESIRSQPSKICPPVDGTLVINEYDLYSESADWDPVNCKLYISSIYNCSLTVYDPYTHTSNIVDLPGITNHGIFNYTEYHLDGVDYDARTGIMYIAAASTNAFTSTSSGDYSNANYTGNNRILKYDTRRDSLISDIDLAPIQAEYGKKTGNLTSGFQDMAEDTNGNSYVIGTFGNSIVKISTRTEMVSLWYYPKIYDITYGFGGIFSIGDMLVVSDTHTQSLVTFDTNADSPVPRVLHVQDMPPNYRPAMADGLFAPKKYGGKVALWSDDFNGTAIYGSSDGWRSARYLGLIPNDDPLAVGTFATATFEIEENIFVVATAFQFQLPQATKTSFPFIDITKKVDDIIKQSGILQAYH